MIRNLILTVLLFLSACALRPTGPSEITLVPVSYDVLPGWRNDHQSEALEALARSCAGLSKKPPDASLGIAGKVKNWTIVCRDLLMNPPANDEATRFFFETRFTPYEVNRGAKGLFTGYFEAELKGSLEQKGPYQTPLWRRPGDMITVDLGEFRQNLKGQRLVGKLSGFDLKPYDDRAAIAKGSLFGGRAEPLVWVDDPIGAFFLEIQGSGRITLPDGTIMRVGYHAQNGKNYVAIGRMLADEGKIERPVTMFKIDTWLRQHPEEAQETMNRNPSVVFFRRIGNEGPIGAQGVVLTPRRSLAVDPAFVPLGVPLWLDLDLDGVAPPPRLVVAQDMGGAIKGPVRGDFFWGTGSAAAANAGAMQSFGTYYLLLPNAVLSND